MSAHNLAPPHAPIHTSSARAQPPTNAPTRGFRAAPLYTERVVFFRARLTDALQRQSEATHNVRAVWLEVLAVGEPDERQTLAALFTEQIDLDPTLVSEDERSLCVKIHRLWHSWPWDLTNLIPSKLTRHWLTPLRKLAEQFPKEQAIPFIDKAFSDRVSRSEPSKDLRGVQSVRWWTPRDIERATEMLKANVARHQLASVRNENLQTPNPPEANSPNSPGTIAPGHQVSSQRLNDGIHDAEDASPTSDNGAQSTVTVRRKRKVKACHRNQVLENQHTGLQSSEQRKRRLVEGHNGVSVEGQLSSMRQGHDLGSRTAMEAGKLKINKTPSPTPHQPDCERRKFGAAIESPVEEGRNNDDGAYDQDTSIAPWDDDPTYSDDSIHATEPLDLPKTPLFSFIELQTIKPSRDHIFTPLNNASMRRAFWFRQPPFFEGSPGAENPANMTQSSGGGTPQGLQRHSPVPSEARHEPGIVEESQLPHFPQSKDHVELTMHSDFASKTPTTVNKEPDLTNWRSGEWLKDNDIDNALGLMQSRCYKVVSAASFDVEDIINGRPVDRLRISSKIKVVVIPFSIKRPTPHWCLATLQLQPGLINFYSSWPSQCYSEQARLVLSLFSSALSAQHPSLHNHRWKWHEVNSMPRQTNTFDCGIFVVVAAFHLMTKRRLPKHVHGHVWRPLLAHLIGTSHSAVKIQIRRSCEHSFCSDLGSNTPTVRNTDDIQQRLMECQQRSQALNDTYETLQGILGFLSTEIFSIDQQSKMGSLQHAIDSLRNAMRLSLSTDTVSAAEEGVAKVQQVANRHQEACDTIRQSLNRLNDIWNLGEQFLAVQVNALDKEQYHLRSQLAEISSPEHGKAESDKLRESKK